MLDEDDDDVEMLSEELVDTVGVADAVKLIDGVSVLLTVELSLIVRDADAVAIADALALTLDESLRLNDADAVSDELELKLGLVVCVAVCVADDEIDSDTLTVALALVELLSLTEIDADDDSLLLGEMLTLTLALMLLESDSDDDGVSDPLRVNDCDTLELRLTDDDSDKLADLDGDTELLAVGDSDNDDDDDVDAVRELVGLSDALTDGDGTRFVYERGWMRHRLTRAPDASDDDDPPTQPITPSDVPSSAGRSTENWRVTGDDGTPDATVTLSTSYPGAALSLTESYMMCTDIPGLLRSAAAAASDTLIGAPTCVVDVDVQLEFANCTTPITSAYAEPDGSTRSVTNADGYRHEPTGGTDRLAPEATYSSCDAFASDDAPFAPACTTNAHARWLASVLAPSISPPRLAVKFTEKVATPRSSDANARDTRVPRSTCASPVAPSVTSCDAPPSTRFDSADGDGLGLVVDVTDDDSCGFHIRSSW